MSKIYARLIDTVVAELISIPDDADIAVYYTPDLVAAMVPANGETRAGMIWNGSQFHAPPPPASPPLTQTTPTVEDLIAALIKKGVIQESDVV